MSLSVLLRLIAGLLSIQCHLRSNLCEAFLEVIGLEFRLLAKLLAITIDNASNNDTFMPKRPSITISCNLNYSTLFVHLD